MKKAILTLIVVTGFALSVPAASQELVRIQADLLNLQNAVRMLQKSVDENAGAAKTLYGQMTDYLNKISRVVEETRSAQAEQLKSGSDNIEDVLNEIRTLGAKIEDLELKVASLYKKVDESQGKIAELKDAFAQRLPSTATGPDGKTVTLPEDKLLALAYSDYTQGNYELAIQGFQDFLKNFPESEFADKAQYYVGDSFYNQSKWAEAVTAFNQVLSLFPKSDWAAAAYLKSGLAYQNAGDNASAITQYRSVILKFPDSTEANIAKEKLKALGAAPPVRRKTTK